MSKPTIGWWADRRIDGVKNMSTLYDLITLGLANGWDMFKRRGQMTSWRVTDDNFLIQVCPGITQSYSLEQIIFNIPWAKAVFGEKDEWHTTKCTCGGNAAHHLGFDTHHDGCARPKANRGFKYHISQYAPLEDRTKYLAEWLDERRTA